VPPAVPQLSRIGGATNRLQSDWAVLADRLFSSCLIFVAPAVNLRAMKTGIILINRCTITC
jgi:hypothetical protein